MTAAEGTSLFRRLIRGLFNLIRPMALLIVFALFPIVVIQSAMYLVDYIECEKIRQGKRSQQETILNKIKAADDDALMISRAIRRVFDHQNQLVSRTAQGRLALRLRYLYEPAFDLYIFDDANRLRSDLSVGSRPRRAVEMCFATLQEVSAGGTSTREKIRLLSSVLNIPSETDQLNAPHALRAIGNRQQDGFFQWGTTSPGHPGGLKGYILLLHPGKFRPNRAIENAIRLSNRRFKSIQFGLVDTVRKNTVLFPPELMRVQGLEWVLMSAASKYDQTFQTAAHFGTFIPRAIPGYLVAYSKQPAFFGRSIMMTVHVFCILWLLVVLWHVPAAGASLGGRIPTKLMGLFLFAIGTPSFVLLLGGYYALKDHENVLMQNLESLVRNKLRVFDDTLPLDVARRELVLKDILERIRATPDLERRRQIFKTVGDLSAIDMAFIINKSGASVATAKSLTDGDKFQKQRNFTVLLARELLNRINKSLTIDAGALAVDAAEGFLGGIVGSFNLDQLSQNLGRFIILSLGTDSSYVFYDAIFGKDGSADYLVFIVMHRGKFHNVYLKTKIPELMKQPAMELTVSGVGEKVFLGSAIFHAANDRARLNEMAKAVIQSRNPILTITPDDGYGRLWYANMGSNLGNFALVATTSLKPVKERVHLLWIILILLAILVFVSALLIGRLLTEHFLEPIAALGEGMRAIEVRQFEHMVPILSTDEFGQLSGLMNHVLDGMKDLQVARIVQESLFPAEPLDAGGFRIWGRSMAMADIGGDYFDYFICRDGRLRGLVGDVSGHGVSAALIMGMAKCALTMDENSGRSLVETITAFNRFLLANIKKKKMMTMFLYSLNPADNTLEFINAGHNFPFLWRAKTGKVAQIGAESFPLGVRAKAVYKSMTIALEPGDSILFYTDGLIEAPGGDVNEFIGYERATQWFESLAHNDPTETISHLFDRFESYTRGRPAADDISMICLKRLA